MTDGKYLPLYSEGASFEFIDSDYFITKIYLNEKKATLQKTKLSEVDFIKEINDRWSEKWSEKWSESFDVKLSDNQIRILALMYKNNKISRKEIAEKLKINQSAVQKHIAKLKKENLIKRIGPDKGGYWQIIEKN